MNVINKILIPRTKLTINYIVLELEEMAREDKYRMKMIKKLKERQKKKPEPICDICKLKIDLKNRFKKKTNEATTPVKSRKPVQVPVFSTNTAEISGYEPGSKADMPQKKIGEVLPVANHTLNLPPKKQLKKLLEEKEDMKGEAQGDSLQALKKLLSEIITTGKNMVETGFSNVDIDSFLRICEDGKTRIDNFLTAHNKPNAKIDPALKDRLNQLNNYLTSIIKLFPELKKEINLTGDTEGSILNSNKDDTVSDKMKAEDIKRQKKKPEPICDICKLKIDLTKKKNNEASIPVRSRKPVKVPFSSTNTTEISEYEPGSKADLAQQKIGEVLSLANHTLNLPPKEQLKELLEIPVKSKQSVQVPVSSTNTVEIEGCELGSKADIAQKKRVEVDKMKAIDIELKDEEFYDPQFCPGHTEDKEFYDPQFWPEHTEDKEFYDPQFCPGHTADTDETNIVVKTKDLSLGKTVTINTIDDTDIISATIESNLKQSKTRNTLNESDIITLTKEPSLEPIIIKDINMPPSKVRLSHTWEVHDPQFCPGHSEDTDEADIVVKMKDRSLVKTETVNTMDDADIISATKESNLIMPPSKARFSHQRSLENLQPIASKVEQEKSEFDSLENLTLRCKDIKEKLEAYKNKVKSQPILPGVGRRKSSQVKIMKDTTNIKPQPDKEFPMENVNEYIDCCENIKRLFEQNDIDRNNTRDVDEICANIDNAVSLLKQIKAESSPNDSLLDILKSFEIPQEESKKHGTKDENISSGLLLTSGDCICPSDSESDELCETCSNNTEQEIDRDQSKYTNSSLLPPIQRQKSIEAEELLSTSDICSTSTFTGPRPTHSTSPTLKTKEEPVVETGNTSSDEPLGVFEKRVKKIVRTKRTLNEDGTIREETETIVIVKNIQNPSGFSIMDNEENLEDVSLDELTKRPNTNVLQLCDDRDQFGFLRQVRSEEITRVTFKINPTLRRCVSINSQWSR